MRRFGLFLLTLPVVAIVPAASAQAQFYRAPPQPYYRAAPPPDAYDERLPSPGYFADDDDGSALAPLRRQYFQQIDRDIGIGTQAIFRAPLDAAFCDQLSDDIDAVGRDIAGNMRVVAADIVTLRMRNVEQRAGIEKEFDDLHVPGHISAV